MDEYELNQLDSVKRDMVKDILRYADNDFQYKNKMIQMVVESEYISLEEMKMDLEHQVTEAEHSSRILVRTDEFTQRFGIHLDIAAQINVIYNRKEGTADLSL